MMYSEFVKGTGCKENEYNYKVFRNLEVMYMNTEMSKQEIYEYGKKLVDNSKSEAELRVEARIKADIEGWKKELQHHRDEIKFYEDNIKFWKEAGDDTMVQLNRNSLKYHKDAAKEARTNIANLKWILNA